MYEVKVAFCEVVYKLYFSSNGQTDLDGEEKNSIISRVSQSKRDEDSAI